MPKLALDERWRLAPDAELIAELYAARGGRGTTGDEEHSAIVDEVRRRALQIAELPLGEPLKGYRRSRRRALSALCGGLMVELLFLGMTGSVSPILRAAGCIILLWPLVLYWQKWSSDLHVIVHEKGVKVIERGKVLRSHLWEQVSWVIDAPLYAMDIEHGGHRERVGYYCAFACSDDEVRCDELNDAEELAHAVAAKTSTHLRAETLLTIAEGQEVDFGAFRVSQSYVRKHGEKRLWGNIFKATREEGRLIIHTDSNWAAGEWGEDLRHVKNALVLESVINNMAQRQPRDPPSDDIVYECKLCGFTEGERNVMYRHVQVQHKDTMDRNWQIAERRRGASTPQ